MNVLYIKWDCYLGNYIEKEISRRYGTIFQYSISNCSDTRHDEKISSDIVKMIIEKRIDFAFSMNYFPVVAVACMACKIKYISWTYDSPYIQLYSRTIEYPTNYAFVFDESEYEKLICKGVNGVYYLPMPACCEQYDCFKIDSQQKEKYRADIAMIGSMYSEKNTICLDTSTKLMIIPRGI